jgi:cyclophilin family peptidyl-prolyl cis-trans isomerase
MRRLIVTWLALPMVLTTMGGCQDQSKPVEVVLETSLGEIQLELYPDKAPETVANFLQYAESDFYDGTIFHRVIPGFVIQGGGYEPGMTERPTEQPIRNEADNGLSNERGTIAMARTQVVDSATSQFFINVADNRPLDHRDDTPRGYGYAVFGRVVDGMDVVDRIVSVPTTTAGPFRDVPREPVVIKDVRTVARPEGQKR